MKEWIKELAAALPAVAVPHCLRELIKKGLSSLLHLAAINFGLVFCFLAGWDVIVNKREFPMIGFGGGASAIMGAWGALLQWNRYMKGRKAGGTSAEPSPTGAGG